MKLNCPECSAEVPAENINIQKMVAVCPSCGAVFPFEAPQTKAKRRKAYQPSALEVHDTDDRLEMAYRTNFRLSQDGSFISSALMSASFTFITWAMFGQVLAARTSLIIPVGFAVLTAFMYYWLASIVYNRTHIAMTDDKITVSRQPLPSLDQPTEISLSGVTVFRYEETPISKREGYDLPRYNVWAETVDGRRRVVVKDVIEDYAVYIAQRLNEQLAVEEDEEDDLVIDQERDVSRLADDDRREDSESDGYSAAISASQGRRA